MPRCPFHRQQSLPPYQTLVDFVIDFPPVVQVSEDVMTAAARPFAQRHQVAFCQLEGRMRMERTNMMHFQMRLPTAEFANLMLL